MYRAPNKTLRVEINPSEVSPDSMSDIKGLPLRLNNPWPGEARRYVHNQLSATVRTGEGSQASLAESFQRFASVGRETLRKGTTNRLSSNPIC